MTVEEEPGFDEFGHYSIEQPTRKISGTTTIDFDGLLSRPLKIHEDVANGCGGQLWPAGLELGAGGGLVGLAVALGCNVDFQEPLLITDQIPMLALMQRNIALNDLKSVHAIVYNWGDDPPDIVTSPPNIILAADCVYFEPAFPLLLKTLTDLIGEDTVCYFCFKRRRRADMRFVKSLKKKFHVMDVGDDVDREVYSKENIHLFEVRKRKI